MIRDERGVVYVEALIAVPIIFIVFACLYAFGHIAAAHLIMQRAASAGVRAAVVFMPDDPVYYLACDSGEACKDMVESEGVAARQACVKQAVRKVLSSGRLFKLEDTSLLHVDWNDAKEWDPVTLTVKAQYDCSKFIGALICGSDHSVEMTASATLLYQQGPIRTQAGH